MASRVKTRSIAASSVVSEGPLAFKILDPVSNLEYCTGEFPPTPYRRSRSDCCRIDCNSILQPLQDTTKYNQVACKYVSSYNSLHGVIYSYHQRSMIAAYEHSLSRSKQFVNYHDCVSSQLHDLLVANLYYRKTKFVDHLKYPIMRFCVTTLKSTGLQGSRRCNEDDLSLCDSRDVACS